MLYLFALFFEVKIVSLMIKFHSGNQWSFVLTDIVQQKETNPRANQLPLLCDLAYKRKNLPLVEVFKNCAFIVKNLD